MCRSILVCHCRFNEPECLLPDHEEFFVRFLNGSEEPLSCYSSVYRSHQAAASP